MLAPPAYASFLVRLWRECDPQRGAPVTDWQGEVEHIQSAQCWTFSSLDELLASMRLLAEDPELLGGTVGK